MSNKRFIKTRSNYTLRKKMSSTPIGTIYERDYMTLIGDGDGNFKFSKNQEPTYQRRHASSDLEVSGDMDLAKQDRNGNNRIILKNRNQSIKDFAFYSSAVELVKKSVENIIRQFPAEIILESGGKVENPFGINLFFSQGDEESMKNPLRFFYKSWPEYEIIYEDVKFAITGWETVDETSDSPSECPDNRKTYSATLSWTNVEGNPDSIHITMSYDRKRKEWVTTHDSDITLRIRPKAEAIEEKYSGFTDFERLLVNRESKPLYRARLETMRYNESGFLKYYEDYTWPSIRQYNPDINGSSYKSYIDKLISMALFYDDNFTDNLWVSMVHEPIKNMDYTYIKDGNNSKIDVDNSTIKAVFDIWSNTFDYLKKSIDSIKNTNRITYDGNGNMPDYMLRDSLEMSGWDIKNVYPSSDANIETQPLFPSMTKGYDSIDANSMFMRALKLNSKSILAKKGTREGVEELLSLFGLTYDDYYIHEYISKATPKGNSTQFPRYEDVARYNKSHDDEFPEQRFNTEDPLDGLPAARVMVTGGEEQDYVIPWFENGKDYDGDIYFQMKGGWGNIKEKKVKNIITGADELVNINGDDDEGNEVFHMFKETSTILKIASCPDNLLATLRNEEKEGEVLYMTSIYGLLEKYRFKPGDECTIDGFSHYFVLEHKESGNTLGYDESRQQYGWKNVLINEFGENLSINARRVLYLESLRDIREGNNPHCGNYEYDSGKSYFDNFRSLFRNKELNLNDSDTQNANAIGYDIEEKVIDGSKVWYFSDTESTADSKLTVTGFTEGAEGVWGEDELDYTDSAALGLYNPEGGESYDEAAANSLINNKYLKIKFFIPANAGEEFEESMKNYYSNVVAFYLEQMIPSTTIFDYEVIEKENPGVAGKAFEEMHLKLNMKPNTSIPEGDLAIEEGRHVDMDRAEIAGVAGNDAIEFGLAESGDASSKDEDVIDTRLFGANPLIKEDK